MFHLNYLGGLGLCRVHLEGGVVWRSALLCWLQGVGGLQQEQEQEQEQQQWRRQQQQQQQ